MADPRFFQREGPFTAHSLIEKAGLSGDCPNGDIELSDIASLDMASADMLSFFSNPKLTDQLAASKAGAILIKQEHAALCPDTSVPIICDDPYLAMAQIGHIFYPLAAIGRPTAGDLQDGHLVHPKAKIGDNVSIAPSAVIGPYAEIGDGCSIGVGAVIGHGVTMGRDCTIGANSCIAYALLGDRVIIQGGAQIGSDGFGFVPSSAHVKIPQLGRVILQADVDVGNNSTIDRGALADTVVGEGSKIDNLVHVAHNVRIGRHCFIAGTTGIAGSVTLGDYVQVAGGVGIAGHIEIGDRSFIAARSNVMRSFPADSKISGMPGRPYGEAYRDQAFLHRLRKAAERSKKQG